MKISIAVCVTLFCTLSYGLAQTTRTIAILDFENNSLAKKQEMAPLTAGLADMLITEFSKLSQFKVVERRQLKQMLEEIKLGQSGMVDQAGAQQAGRMLGARNLVLGSFMHMFDGKIRIDVRIVEVETGLTIKAEEVTGKPKALHKLITKLVVKIAQNLDVKLTKADTKELARVENTSFDAALYYAKGLDFEDAGEPEKAKTMFKKALKLNPKFTKAREKLQ